MKRINEPAAKDFKDKKAIIWPFLDRKTCALLSRLVYYDSLIYFEADDEQSPGQHSRYAQPWSEALTVELLSTMETVTGLELWPTYSYYRLYTSGAFLPRHIDRPSCEISVSITLGYQFKDKPDYKWPLMVADSLWCKAKGFPVILEIGDGMVYRGVEVQHWREKLEVEDGGWQAQVFCHYVDKNGPYADRKFDFRKEGMGGHKTAEEFQRTKLDYHPSNLRGGLYEEKDIRALKGNVQEDKNYKKDMI